MAIQDTVARGRSLSEKFMPLSVLVKKPGERVPDNRGHYIVTEGETIETKGRLTDMSAEERIVAERLQESVEGVLIVPFGIEITSADSLEIDGVPYHVRGVPPGTPEYTAHVRVLVSRA